MYSVFWLVYLGCLGFPPLDHSATWATEKKFKTDRCWIADQTDGSAIGKRCASGYQVWRPRQMCYGEFICGLWEAHQII